MEGYKPFQTHHWTVKWTEKFVEPFSRIVSLFVSITKPLKSRYALREKKKRQMILHFIPLVFWTLVTLEVTNGPAKKIWVCKAHDTVSYNSHWIFPRPINP